MTLTEYGYKPRLIDGKIAKYMRLFGALSIEGPKWCGKTWTALNHAKSVVYMLDPENDYANWEAARLNPASILTGENLFLSMNGRKYRVSGTLSDSLRTGQRKKPVFIDRFCDSKKRQFFAQRSGQDREDQNAYNVPV